MNNISNNQNNQNMDYEYEFINLGKILNLIFRNKKTVAFSCVLFFIAACLYSLTIKRTWQGNFQIVIENTSTNKSNSSTQLGDLSFLNLLGTATNSFKGFNTEIAILKSPLVLMPVFEYVNKQNNKSEIGSQLNSYDFEKWKNDNLEVALKKNTQILQVKYKDSNKSIILPVLQKISTTYQKYSKTNNNENIEQVQKYLEKQIGIYSSKSRESIKKVQEFAIDEDLSLAFGESNNKLASPIIDVETIRTRAANSIRTIDKQIEQIKNAKDPEFLQYLGSTIEILSKEGLTEKLKEIEESLLQTRLVFKENTSPVKRIIKERELNIELIKERALGILEAQKLSKKATLEAAKRPKDVLIKYKELIRKAQRDEATLVSLENQLLEIKLLKARESTPWELVTQPTIRNTPIAPSRKKIGITGLFLGFISGILIALYKEKKSGIIYEINEIEKLTRIKIINNEIDIKDLKFLNLFLNDLVNKYKDKKISLFLIGNDLENIKSNIISSSESKLFENNIKFNLDLSSFNSEDYNFLVINMGSTRYYDFAIFKSRMEFLKLNFDGIIKVNF